MAVTLKQLAAELKLDHSTVAYALSGKGRISQATRERVIKAAERLGYVPNRLARGMRARRTNTIGLVLTDVVYSPYTQVVQHLLTQVNAQNRELLIALHQFNPRLEEAGVRRMIESQVDGILIKATRPTWDNYPENHPLQQAVKRGIPIVYYYTEPENALGPAIGDPRIRSFALVLEHLADLGHRHIAALFPVAEPFGALSLLMKKAADVLCQARGISLRYVSMPTRSGGNLPEYINQHNPEYALGMGRELFTRAMELDPRPTAVVGFNDVIATGAVLAAQSAGMRIPEDIAIGGCYRLPSSSFCPIPLTSCDTRPFEYAKEMLAMLEQQIENPSREVTHRRLEPVLVPAESTVAEKKRKGFTLVELLVVIGIVALLISILLPALSRARRAATSVQCLSNLKQLYTATLFYANEWKNVLPRANTEFVINASTNPPTRIEKWHRQLTPYLTTTDNAYYDWNKVRLYACPSSALPQELQNQIQYGMNQRIDLGADNASNVKITQIMRPTEIYLYADKTELDWAPIITHSGTYMPLRRHGSGDHPRDNNAKANVVFFDGHCDSISKAETANQRNYDFRLR